MGSNFRKMHSALADAYMVLVKARMDKCPIPEDVLVRVITTIESALAIKQRNCDIGTADEQTDRYDEYCNGYFKENDNGGTCENCPLASRANWSCQLAWSQMPYEEVAEKEGGEE